MPLPQLHHQFRDETREEGKALGQYSLACQRVPMGQLCSPAGQEREREREGGGRQTEGIWFDGSLLVFL